MNRKNLDIIISQYIERFDELNDTSGNDEGYKWRAVSCFKDKWKIDDENFPQMFREAMKATSNLIDNKTVQPIGGINELLKHDNEVEFVRECFQELFSDDNENLKSRQDRIEAFADKINARIDTYVHGSWKYPQAINNVIYYLNLWKPEENYIFKSTEAYEWAACIEYGDDFGSGQTFSLEKYYKMCDELLAELPRYDELMSLNGRRFATEARGFDDKLHILVYDIIYCAHAYNFYTGMEIRKVSTRERIEIAKHQTERDELSAQIAELESRLQTLEGAAVEFPEMNGKTVIHKVFGEGRVSDRINNTLTVDFSTAQKKFVCPDAFLNGFLKCDDEDTINKIKGFSEQNKEISALKKEISRLKSELQRINGSA